jgi:hypothetical protein
MSAVDPSGCCVRREPSGRGEPGGMSGCKRLGAARTASGDNADSVFNALRALRGNLFPLSAMPGGGWSPLVRQI